MATIRIPDTGITQTIDWTLKMENKNVEAMAVGVLGKMNPGVTKFDPMMILLVIQGIYYLFKLYRECQKTPEDIHNDALHITRGSKWNPMNMWRRRKMRNAIAQIQGLSQEDKDKIVEVLPLWASYNKEKVALAYNEYN